MKTRRGFTLVELLIVIIVIVILATIVAASYTSVQKRGRDALRKQAVDDISKALELYNSDNGPMYTGSGCGNSGNGSGYVNYTYPGYTSIMDCLIASDALKNAISSPSGAASCSGLGCDTYMKSTCIQSGRKVSYIYANLELVGHTSTDTDTTCSNAYDTSYGMNYFVKVIDR